MCRLSVPKYRCGHYGEEFRSCDADEYFHGKCKGMDPHLYIIRHKHCCSEECCFDSMRRAQEEVYELDGDPWRTEELALAKAYKAHWKERHENVCMKLPRDDPERYGGPWFVRDQESKSTSKAGGKEGEPVISFMRDWEPSRKGQQVRRDSVTDYCEDLVMEGKAVFVKRE